jgi:PII-like signaling protein
MITPGLAKKITIHLNEDTSASHDFLYNEIFGFLRERGVTGATMIHPQSGDAAATDHLPVRIEFIESHETTQALLPALCDLITNGLVEVQDTTVLKIAMRKEPV